MATLWGPLRPSVSPRSFLDQEDFEDGEDWVLVALPLLLPGPSLSALWPNFSSKWLCLLCNTIVWDSKWSANRLQTYPHISLKFDLWIFPKLICAEYLTRLPCFKHDAWHKGHVTKPCDYCTIIIISVFHKNTFFKKELGHTLTCPSGAYITQIRKLFSFGQV